MIRILLGLAAIAFVAFLLFVSTTQDTAHFFALLDELWVQVLVADFYLGVICFTAVIWAVERNALSTVIWGLATAGLGNPVAAVWLILRGLPRLAER